MRDLKKWAIGAGTTLAITLVGAVLDMRSSMSSISSTVELTNKHFEQGLMNTNKLGAIHNARLTDHEGRIIRLEGKDEVHDRYDAKLEELIPTVQKIYIIMKKDAEGKQWQ